VPGADKASIKASPAPGSHIHFSCLLRFGEQGELQWSSPHSPLSLLLLLLFWLPGSRCLHADLDVSLAPLWSAHLHLSDCKCGGWREEGEGSGVSLLGLLGIRTLSVPTLPVQASQPEHPLLVSISPAYCSRCVCLAVLSAGPPPSHSHVLLRSVPSLWPDPAGQQLQ